MHEDITKEVGGRRMKTKLNDAERRRLWKLSGERTIHWKGDWCMTVGYPGGRSTQWLSWENHKGGLFQQMGRLADEPGTSWVPATPDEAVKMGEAFFADIFRVMGESAYACPPDKPVSICFLNPSVG